MKDTDWDIARRFIKTEKITDRNKVKVYGTCDQDESYIVIYSQLKYANILHGLKHESNLNYLKHMEEYLQKTVVSR